MVPRLCLDTELLTKEGTLKGRGLVVYRLCANLGGMNLEHFLIIRLSFEDGTKL